MAKQNLKSVLLTIKDVEEVLSQEVVIGTRTTSDGDLVKFTFNPWKNEYNIYQNKDCISGGQALEELLSEYNEL